MAHRYHLTLPASEGVVACLMQIYVHVQYMPQSPTDPEIILIEGLLDKASFNCVNIYPNGAGRERKVYKMLSRL